MDQKERRRLRTLIFEINKLIEFVEKQKADQGIIEKIKAIKGQASGLSIGTTQYYNQKSKIQTPETPNEEEGVEIIKCIKR